MALSSVSVMSNALLLKRWQPRLLRRTKTEGSSGVR
jgi:cation transport ATPase